MALKETASKAAIYAAIPTLLLSVAGYMNARTEVEKVRTEQLKQQENTQNRDSALLKAYESLLARCSGLREDRQLAAPSPAPPPPPASYMPSDSDKSVSRLEESSMAQIVPSTPSRTLDVLAKQYGFIEKK